MEGTYYNDFILENPYLKNKITRTYDGGKMELIVETTDGCIYSYDALWHILYLVSKGEPSDEDRKRIFGKKLKKMIWLAGMNQYDLARELGVNVMTISNYVNGKTVPTFIQTQKIIQILKCDTKDLFYMG